MLLLLLSLAVAAFAVPYTCPSTSIVLPFQSRPYYFPSRGADEHFATNQICNFTIQIPLSYYATISVHTSNLKNRTEFVPIVENFKTYPFGIHMLSNLAPQFVFSSAAPSVGIVLFADKKKTMGTFGFNVTWQKTLPLKPSVTYSIPNHGYMFYDPANVERKQRPVTFKSQMPMEQVALTTSCGANFLAFIGLRAMWLYDSATVNLAGNHRMMVSSWLGPSSSTNHALTMYYPLPVSSVQGFNYSNSTCCMSVITNSRSTAQYSSYLFHFLNCAGPTVHIKKMDNPFLKLDNPLNVGNQVAADAPYATTVYSKERPIVVENITWLNVTEGKPAFVMAYLGIPKPTSMNLPQMVFSDSTRMPYAFSSNVVTFVMFHGEAEIITLKKQND